jgi:hypothetical protein
MMKSCKWRALGKSLMEVSLFVGHDSLGHRRADPSMRKNLGARLRDGTARLRNRMYLARDLGIRSVLVADEGLLWLVNEMKKTGELPPNLVVKVSVQMGAANPISVRWMEQLGAGTYNVPTDLSLPQLAALRQACRIPFDIYIEAPDDFGGFLRYYEVPEMVRIAAPVYVKLGLRNAPNIYPSGTHLEATAVATARERVHRASIAAGMLQRYFPEAIASPQGAADLGIPEV